MQTGGTMLNEKKRSLNIVIGCLSGAFSAHVLSGFCIWFISVSPDFLPLYFVIDLFPAPLILGGVASLFYGWIIRGRNTFRAFLLAFSSTFLSILLAFLLAPILSTFVLGALINLNNLALSRIYFLALEIGIGVFFMSTIIAAFRLLFIRKRQDDNGI